MELYYENHECGTVALWQCALLVNIAHTANINADE
jgi:hypothetical protein